MAQGDIFQLRVLYHDKNLEPMQNVFYYEQTEQGEVTAAQLRSSFVTTVVTEMQDMWPAETIIDSIRTINGMDNNDFDLDLTNRIGQNASTAYLPSFIAAGFRNPPAGPGQQYAYKRFGGMTGQFDNPTGRWDSSLNALMADLAAVLDNILAPNSISCTPCIIKGGFKLGTSPTFGRYLDSTWQYNDWPTTQNTRKQYLWV